MKAHQTTLARLNPALATVLLALAWQPAPGLGARPLRSAEVCRSRPRPRFTAEDERFMRLAVRTAEEGVRGGGFPFGAAIVRGGEVIAVVGNSVQRDADPTAHAEMQAIRGACRKLNSRDLSACTIYATGEPCPMCFSACFWARIPRIVFGATLEEIRKAGVRQLMVSTRQMKAAGKVEIESSGGCLREENLALLRLWSKQPRP